MRIRANTAATTIWHQGEYTPVLVLALLKLLLHLLTIERYGYYRDELYFLVCGTHLDFGYVDHPPLVPALAAVVRSLLGDSLLAIRLWPALSGATLVVLAGTITRLFGGGRFAQFLAALAIFCTPLFWRSHSMLTLAAFEALLWTLCCILVVQIVKDPLRMSGKQIRLWLSLGLVIGIGLLNKYSLALYVVALLGGFLLAAATRYIAAPRVVHRELDTTCFTGRYRPTGRLVGGCVFALLVAAILVSPNVIWQYRHGWPSLEFLGYLHGELATTVSLFEFTAGQLFWFNPVNAFLWLAGLWWLLRGREAQPYRAFGWSYLLLFVFFALVKAKIYYLAPAYPVLFSAGAVAFEKWAAAPFPTRRRLVHIYVLAVIFTGVTMAPLGLRVLPIEKVDNYVKFLTAGQRSGQVVVGQYYDMFGWREIAATMDSLWAELPPADRSHCAILAGNYGEASAIDVLGRGRNRPQVFCGHNSYFLWGPPPSNTTLCLAIGIPASQLTQAFTRVGLLTELHPAHSVYYESNLPVFLCREISGPWEEVWPRFKLYR